MVMYEKISRVNMLRVFKKIPA